MMPGRRGHRRRARSGRGGWRSSKSWCHRLRRWPPRLLRRLCCTRGFSNGSQGISILFFATLQLLTVLELDASRDVPEPMTPSEMNAATDADNGDAAPLEHPHPQTVATFGDDDSDIASTASQPSSPRIRPLAHAPSPTAHPHIVNVVSEHPGHDPAPDNVSAGNAQPSADGQMPQSDRVASAAAECESSPPLSHAPRADSPVLGQLQLWEAKIIVLDLLGWGVPPSYLVACGLQPKLVIRIFNELNLKLPDSLLVLAGQAG